MSGSGLSDFLEVQVFRNGQTVRVVRNVATNVIDERFEYPGIDYDEYARIHIPVTLLAGSVVRFDSYLTLVRALWVMTLSKSATDLCQVVIGRGPCSLVDVPPDVLEGCEQNVELTPRIACVKPPPDFWNDRETHHE
jgi:hypothetical protein